MSFPVGSIGVGEQLQMFDATLKRMTRGEALRYRKFTASKVSEF